VVDSQKPFLEWSEKFQTYMILNKQQEQATVS